jgi:hypothetical protein
MYEKIKGPIYIFHGGCSGCTQQHLNGIKFCKGCQYFKPDWDLPSLNNRPKTEAEIIKEQLLNEPDDGLEDMWNK